MADEPCAECAAADAEAAAAAATGANVPPRSRCACGRSFTPALPPPAPDAAGASGLPLAAEDRLTRLVRRWRAAFIDRVRPVAMPEGWSITYRVFQAGLRRDTLTEPELVQECVALLLASPSSSS